MAALNRTSPVVIKALEIASSFFSLSVQDILGDGKQAEFVAARRGLFHGLLSSGVFNSSTLSRCFFYDQNKLPALMRHVNLMLREPRNDLERKTVELSALICNQAKLDVVVTPATTVHARVYEQVAIPVLRPDWPQTVTDSCVTQGLVLNEGFLISTAAAKLPFYPEPLRLLLARHILDTEYAWIKPRAI